MALCSKKLFTVGHKIDRTAVVVFANALDMSGANVNMESENGNGKEGVFKIFLTLGPVHDYVMRITKIQ